jgi:hypothetical protein
VDFAELVERDLGVNLGRVVVAEAEGQRAEGAEAEGVMW